MHQNNGLPGMKANSFQESILSDDFPHYFGEFRELLVSLVQLSFRNLAANI